MLLTVYGTEWRILCWCVDKKLLTHSPHALAETNTQFTPPTVESRRRRDSVNVSVGWRHPVSDSKADAQNVGQLYRSSTVGLTNCLVSGAETIRWRHN